LNFDSATRQSLEEEKTRADATQSRSILSTSKRQQDVDDTKDQDTQSPDIITDDLIEKDDGDGDLDNFDSDTDNGSTSGENVGTKDIDDDSNGQMDTALPLASPVVDRDNFLTPQAFYSDAEPLEDDLPSETIDEDTPDTIQSLEPELLDPVEELESEATFGFHETLIASFNVFKDQSFDLMLLSLAGTSASGRCLAVIGSSSLCNYIVCR
jgi:hypothetical protein